MGPSTLQQNTSISRVFVLGALVLAMLLATWWVRPPSMTVGVGNGTTEVKEHFRAQLFKCCVNQMLAEEFFFGKNMKAWREGLER